MEVKLSELKELMTPRMALSNEMIEAGVMRDLGTQIVALDRGFVYVGQAKISGSLLTIEGAKCIRRWGTTAGLGELRNGPTAKTVLDEAGTVLAPMKSVIHLIACTPGKW